MEQVTLGQRQEAQAPPRPAAQEPKANDRNRGASQGSGHAAGQDHTQLNPQSHAQPDTQGQAPQGQAMEADVQAHLGRQLRAVYDEMTSQPVPDRFIQLLDALERKSVRTQQPASVSTSSAKVGGA